MFLASQVIWLSLLEKTSSCTKFPDVLGRFFSSRSKGLHSSVSLLVPRKLAVTTRILHQCDNRFLGRLSCYPYHKNPKGNTLAATECVRLLEV